jgi:hypothetical protein
MTMAPAALPPPIAASVDKETVLPLALVLPLVPPPPTKTEARDDDGVKEAVMTVEDGVAEEREVPAWVRVLDTELVGDAACDGDAPLDMLCVRVCAWVALRVAVSEELSEEPCDEVPDAVLDCAALDA